jgi:plasmid stabilization system protein ParE
VIELIWSKRAETSFETIAHSIRTNFSKKEEDYFVYQVYEILEVIIGYPKGFPESKVLKGTRKAVIHPHSTLFYRIEGRKQIRLLLFWDNRKNPKKISR